MKISKSKFRFLITESINDIYDHVFISNAPMFQIARQGEYVFRSHNGYDIHVYHSTPDMGFSFESWDIAFISNMEQEDEARYQKTLWSKRVYDIETAAKVAMIVIERFNLTSIEDDELDSDSSEESQYSEEETETDDDEVDTEDYEEALYEIFRSDTKQGVDAKFVNDLIKKQYDKDELDSALDLYKNHDLDVKNYATFFAEPDDSDGVPDKTFVKREDIPNLEIKNRTLEDFDIAKKYLPDAFDGNTLEGYPDFFSFGYMDRDEGVHIKVRRSEWRGTPQYSLDVNITMPGKDVFEWFTSMRLEKPKLSTVLQIAKHIFKNIKSYKRNVGIKAVKNSYKDIHFINESVWDYFSKKVGSPGTQTKTLDKEEEIIRKAEWDQQWNSGVEETSDVNDDKVLPGDQEGVVAQPPQHDTQSYPEMTRRSFLQALGSGAALASVAGSGGFFDDDMNISSKDADYYDDREYADGRNRNSLSNDYTIRTIRKKTKEILSGLEGRKIGFMYMGNQFVIVPLDNMAFVSPVTGERLGSIDEVHLFKMYLTAYYGKEIADYFISEYGDDAIWSEEEIYEEMMQALSNVSKIGNYTYDFEGIEIGTDEYNQWKWTYVDSFLKQNAEVYHDLGYVLENTASLDWDLLEKEHSHLKDVGIQDFPTEFTWNRYLIDYYEPEIPVYNIEGMLKKKE